MLALLLMAFVAPALFGLIGSEVGARRERLSRPRLGDRRAYRHRCAVGLARAGAGRRLCSWQPPKTSAAQRCCGCGRIPSRSRRYKWHLVAETPQYYQTAEVDTLHGTVTTSQEDILYKPPTTNATQIAKRSWLGEVYLDWSQLPLVEEEGRSGDPDAGALTTVTFRDLRFMYDVAFLRGRKTRPCPVR